MNKERAETILVVDDNVPMRKALAETLKVLRYHTLEAGNGSEALEILENSGADHLDMADKAIALIMSDMAMPVMDGRELFYELKKRNQKIPVVLLTGYVVKSELDELRKDGLSGWLIKPADIDQIARLLEDILE